MKSLSVSFVLLTLLALVSSLPNPAAYIKAENRPLNIAHRGLCSLLPENTLEAFEAALYQGADFIELDVVYTKEKKLLVMHDPYLTRITNVKNKPEFATRYQTRQYNFANKTDWWTDTFTLAELKTLGIRQAQAKGRISIFDYNLTFTTLADVIQMVLQFNVEHAGKRNPDGRLAGILIQAKDSQMYRDLYGLEIGKTILDLLKEYGLDTIEKATQKVPIYLHSFDYGSIKYWAANTELPCNYLVKNNFSEIDLEDANKYATGIGFAESLLFNQTSGQITPLFYKAKGLGLLTHIWTFQDDSKLFFNAKTNIEAYDYAQNTMKLDGVITQFADIYAPLAQVLKGKKSEEVVTKRSLSIDER